MNVRRLLYPLTLACLGALAFAGCGKVRYPTNYILNLPPPAPRTPAPQEALGALAISEFQCPEYLCEGRIVYRPSPEEVGFYEYHRWATSPRQSITQFMADAVRAQSVFKVVAVNDRGMEAAYVLSGNIERLEEVDQGSEVQAVCTISAQLLNVQTKSVVWSQTASETVPVESRNVPGVVRSLSTAARITVERLAESMVKELTPSR